jgi:hypothetical protein
MATQSAYLGDDAEVMGDHNHGCVKSRRRSFIISSTWACIVTSRAVSVRRQSQVRITGKAIAITTALLHSAGKTDVGIHCSLRRDTTISASRSRGSPLPLR